MFFSWVIIYLMIKKDKKIMNDAGGSAKKRCIIIFVKDFVNLLWIYSTAGLVSN